MKTIQRSLTSLICVALISFSAQFSLAETAYIKDEIYVPLRSGPSSKHRILHKGIRSNTQLSVIEVDEEAGWVHVRTPSQLEGWIPSQYIVKSPTASIKLNALSQKHSALSAELEKLKAEYAKAQNALSKSQSSLKTTESAQQQATMELRRIKSISSGAIELDRKYQKLLEDHELLQTSNDALNAENSSLKNDQRFSYMFYGAALIIIGMLMAVIIPRLKLKKRHSEWAN